MMSTSRKPARARPAIFAALLVSLTTPALAQAAILRPGGAKVYLGGVQNVQSTRHYQAYGLLKCDFNVCNVAFPPPGANHRINLTHIACVVTAELGTQFQAGLVALSGNNTLLLTNPLPLGWSVDGIFYFNQPINVQVEATQQVHTDFAFGGKANGGSCTLGGTFDTLN